MRTTTPMGKSLIWPVVVLAVTFLGTGVPKAQLLQVMDPGVRGGDPGAGGPIDGLSPTESAFFKAGQDEFADVEEVEDGIGPRMNLNSCGGCHSQPAIGGSSPLSNPQMAFASGGSDSVPFFITINGPIREARFKFNPDGTRDGGVHNDFTISARTGASDCSLKQPDFLAEFEDDNLIFRIPAPLFGAGLIEQIPDRVILDNWAANSNVKMNLGIKGRPNMIASGQVSGSPNLNGNDGTVARFGWKAQNKSLLLFSGEAYNVEMGITNELFQTEREEDPACQFATFPNDVTEAGPSPIELFALFQRFLAPPKPSADTPGGAPSINRGRGVFESIGCDMCHTPRLRTGNSTVAALRDKDVNLYSDLLLHHMGPGLADNILQGQALGDEFRTAPLWGLGQRIFFLHDGRTADLIEAIQEHRSRGNDNTGNGNNNGKKEKFESSEANAVIDNFDELGMADKQDLLNFLRSL
jgi:CxxC motif-containing protein (DUF1111 family)